MLPPTIAVGDTYWYLGVLRGLLDLLQPTPADTLVFLGDYVSRGPESRGVL